jgi:hypothetical protein
MHPLPATSEPRHGWHRGECLAFARLHLRDAAASERQRAAKLYIIHFLTQNSRRRYCHGRHELQQASRPHCYVPKLVIAHTGEFEAYRVDPLDGTPVAIERRK